MQLHVLNDELPFLMKFNYHSAFEMLNYFGQTTCLNIAYTTQWLLSIPLIQDSCMERPFYILFGI